MTTLLKTVHNPFGVNLSNPNLVFYAPLWHPGLAMSPFISRDIYRRSCTVTGATWGSQGRTLDGADDMLLLGAACPAALNFANGSPWSFESWVYWNAYNVANYDSWAGGRTDSLNFWQRVNSVNTIQFRDGASAFNDFTAGISLGVWSHIVITADASGNMILYINGAVAGITLTGINTAVLIWHFGGGRADNSYRLNGRIGEVGAYNRALSLSEINNNYQSTKWRYGV